MNAKETEKPMMPGELAAKLGVSGQAITAAKKMLGLKRQFVFESEILKAMHDPNFKVRADREASVWIGVKRSGSKYVATAKGSGISANHQNPLKAISEVAAQLFQDKTA